MKTIRLLIAFFTVAVMAGCATTGHEDTTTGVVAGGLLGGGLTKAAGGSATKGAVTGALIGAGIGVLSDAQNRKDNERAEKTNAILQQRGVGIGSVDMETVRTDAQTDANLAFAQKERNNCETEFAKEKRAGMNPVYTCKEVFEAAYAEAKGNGFYGPYDGSYNCSAAYLRAHGIRPGSQYASMWCGRLRQNDREDRHVYRWGR